MKNCEVCGNEYENIFEVKLKSTGASHYFDCFECAVAKLAPECLHCGVKIIGHGVQVGQQMFCCAHCARSEGFKTVVDHGPVVTAVQ